MGVFDKSFSASVRVDARDLAVVGNWMQANGQEVTRSSIIGQALKIVAKGVLDQEPERQIDTLEQAYTKLFNMGLAPKSTQSLLTMAKSLRSEQMAQAGDMQGIVKYLSNVAHGSGLAKDEAKEAVAKEMLNITENQRTPNTADAYGIDEQDMVDINYVASYMRENGASSEEIEEAKKKAIAKAKRRKLLENDETLARQAEGIKQGTEVLREQKERAKQKADIPAEERLRKFEEKIIENFGWHYETDLQDKYVNSAIQGYKQFHFPDATDEEVTRWVDKMVAEARPLIEKRPEKIKAELAKQEKVREDNKKKEAAKRL